MAAFTLKLGDLDLSNYVRVAQGDGLDPAASEYLTPEFQQSGLQEGNALAAVVANNREMAFPLHLFSRETAYTNLVLNPSLETNADEWSKGGLGPAITRTTAWAARGVGAGVLEYTNDETGGASIAQPLRRIAVTVGETYEWSVDINVVDPPGEHYRIDILGYDAASGGTNVASQIGDHLTGTREGRLTLTWTIPSGVTHVVPRIRADSNGVAGTPDSCTIYFDAAYFGKSGSAYFDGDSGGCQWDGTPHASTSSTRVGRSGLLDLLADLNRRLDGASDGSKLELEWRNEGANNSTFYDVVFGRFEHEYNHRRLAHKWMSGILRCWVRPYGHTGTTRILGTALSPTLPVTKFTPSGIEGDVDAAVRWGFDIVNYQWTATRVPAVFAMSVLPHASYPYRTPAASQNPGGNIWGSATVTGGSGAAGSQYIGNPVSVDAYQGGGNALFRHVSSRALFGTHALEHRVLAMVRSKMRHGVAIRGYDLLGNDWIGPTAVATLAEWHLVDLGVLRLPDSSIDISAYTANLGVYGGGLASGALGTTQPAPSCLASPGLHINEVYIVPEETTAFCVVPTHATEHSNERYVFDGYENHKYRASQSADGADMSQWMRGQIPKVSPSAPGVLFLHHLSNSFANTRTLNAEFAVRERFTFER